MFPYCWTHLKSIDGLQVKKSGIQGAGQGLFFVGTKDKDKLKKGERVTYYSGKEIVREPIEGDYVMRVSSKQYLDGEHKQNHVGRYINSSKGSRKRPNVKFSGTTQIRNQMGRPSIPIIATRTIKKGDELLANYGRSYRI